MSFLLPIPGDIFPLSKTEKINPNTSGRCRIMEEKDMETARIRTRKAEAEKLFITAGMFFMEAFGAVMLICGIMDIKII